MAAIDSNQSLKTLYMMKKNLFIAAAVLTLCTAACTLEKTDVSSESRTSDRTVVLKVSVPCPVTKATDSEGEETVGSLQVFVFRPDGTLDASSSAEASEVSVSCTAGQKKVVAVVNAPQLSDIHDLTSLEQSVSLLSDNSKGRYVMYGKKDVDVVGSVPVTVEVARLVARVSIHKITNAFTLEQYQDATVELVRIFLLNAAGDVQYGGGSQPSVWHNTLTLKNEVPGLLQSEGINEQIAYNTSYSQPHYFYCYPNPTEADSSEEDWSPRYSRLVVEISVDGQTYYYPVSVPGILGNHKYEITELKITRLGSESPDIPVSVHEASFTVTVDPWDDGMSSAVEI